MDVASECRQHRDACSNSHNKNFAFQQKMCKRTCNLCGSSGISDCLREKNSNQWGEARQVIEWLFNSRATGYRRGGFYFEIGALDGLKFR